MKKKFQQEKTMSYSYKNTSKGGEGKGNSSAHHLAIKEHQDPRPPAGASNSYEKVRNKIDAHNDASLRKRPYTKEKMENK